MWSDGFDGIEVFVAAGARGRTLCLNVPLRLRDVNPEVTPVVYVLRNGWVGGRLPSPMVFGYDGQMWHPYEDVAAWQRDRVRRKRGLQRLGYAAEAEKYRLERDRLPWWRFARRADLAYKIEVALATYREALSLDMEMERQERERENDRMIREIHHSLTSR